jgi:DNA-binding response OmpR family regulator
MRGVPSTPFELPLGSCNRRFRWSLTKRHVHRLFQEGQTDVGWPGLERFAKPRKLSDSDRGFAQCGSSPGHPRLKQAMALDEKMRAKVAHLLTKESNQEGLPFHRLNAAIMRILIVEDEEALALGLKFNFEQEGYEVLLAGDGPTAMKLFQESSPPVNLIILDLMLPGMSGYEICKAIRVTDKTVPILVLSARTLSEDRMHAFDCGTDQYITKPFVLPELLNRVKNLLERHKTLLTAAKSDAPEPAAVARYEFQHFRLDPQSFEVVTGDRRQSLTTQEMQLLRYFIEHEGEVLSRYRILEEVWDENVDVTTRTIDNFVLRLRKLIEPDPARPQYILSVRGTGYRFVSGRTTAGDKTS